MGPAAAAARTARPQAVVLDDDHLPRCERLDGFEPEVVERDALARRGEQRSVDGVAERPNPLRIAEDDHVSHCVEVDDVVGPVELLAQATKYFDEVRAVVSAKLVRDVVHEDFGVRLARQVIVVESKEVGRSSGKLAS